MIIELRSVHSSDSVCLASGDEPFITSVKNAFSKLWKENMSLVQMGQQELNHPFARGYNEQILSHTGQGKGFISHELGVELLRRIEAPDEDARQLILQAIEKLEWAA